MTSIERRMVDAYRAGQDAARRAPHRPNPHNGMAADRAERLQSVMWRRGYMSVVNERVPEPTDDR